MFTNVTAFQLMNDSNKELTQIFKIELRRAKRLAAWSFIGILMPLIGIILGMLSRSIIKSLPTPKSERLLEKFQSTKNLAFVGIIVSLAFMVVWWGAGVWIGNWTNNNTTAREKAAYEQGYREGDQDGFNRGLNADDNLENINNQMSLDTCINEVNERFNSAYRQARTNEDLQTLTMIKEQQVSECQIRYPTN